VLKPPASGWNDVELNVTGSLTCTLAGEYVNDARGKRAYTHAFSADAPSREYTPGYSSSAHPNPQDVVPAST
jgi:hypothetical protein